MNLPLVGLFTRMLTIPLWFLVPAIAAVSAVGVYAVHSTTFDLLLMVGLGVFGYILRKMHFPMSPLILGFVLGEMLEQNLRRAVDQQRRVRHSVEQQHRANAAGAGGRGTGAAAAAAPDAQTPPTCGRGQSRVTRNGRDPRPLCLTA